MEEPEFQNDCLKRIKDSLDSVIYKSAMGDILNIVIDSSLSDSSKVKLIKYTALLVLEEKLTDE